MVHGPFDGNKLPLPDDFFVKLVCNLPFLVSIFSLFPFSVVYVPVTGFGAEQFRVSVSSEELPSREKKSEQT